MSDSNSTLTRERIVSRAFGRIGLDSPSTQEGAVAAEILNDVIAEMDPQGRWLWAISNTESTLTTIATQRSYAAADPVTASTIPVYIQGLESVTLIRGVSRTPLRIIDKNEYVNSWELETSNTGDPYLAYLELAPNPANQKLWLLPTPSAALTIGFFYQRMLYDLDVAADNPDVMRSMRLGLIKILAAELAPYHGVSITERQGLEMESANAKMLFKKFNQEKKDSVPVVAQYF